MSTPANGPRWRRRAPLVLALAASACFGDCSDPLSESARRGDPQALVSVSHDSVFDGPLPAVVYRDAIRTVRILADTIRLYPGQLRYRRKTVFGVRNGDGPEIVQPQPAPWVTHTLYEVDDIADRYAVLDSFDIVPGLPPGSARWDSYGGTDTALVYVQWETHMDSAGSGRRAYSARWAPTRRR